MLKVTREIKEVTREAEDVVKDGVVVTRIRQPGQTTMEVNSTPRDSGVRLRGSGSRWLEIRFVGLVGCGARAGLTELTSTSTRARSTLQV